jgi:hypothetical protein
MAKYLSMTSATVPMAEIEAIEAELSWNDQAVAALALLEQYRGDVAAAIADIAQQAGMKTSDLMNQADQAARKIASDAAKSAIAELPGLANGAATVMTAPKLGPASLLVGYFVATVVRTALKSE